MNPKRRLHNFSSGPSILPLEVLEEAAEHLVVHPDAGVSIMELSHRTPVWEERIQQAETDLRDLMAIPEDYAVLFLQGGASMQFAMVPLNLMAPGQSADFINSGTWSTKAIAEVVKVGRAARVCGTSEATGFDRIPRDLDIDPDAAYVHYVSNNTIYGTEVQSPPEVGDRILVCDASSNILSRPMDVSRHGLIFAGAQKNLGPAGLTLVIVRRDLLDRITWTLPTMLTYATHANKGSMFNTPPVWAIYITGLVLKWLKRQGGAEAIAARNARKASLLYSAIDESALFEGCTTPDSRSRMNVTFRLTQHDDTVAQAFFEEAAALNMAFLKGHRSVGGFRAALYNAMPVESVQLLADFIRDFSAQRS